MWPFTILLVPMLCVLSLSAQTSAVAPGFHRISEAELATKGRELLRQAAKSSDGMSLVVLEKYTGNFAELVARTKTGSAELHADWDDYFLVVDGEATELTGGTMVDGKDTGSGEIRGTSLRGAAATQVHKGDVIHISAKTPHQAVIAPGKSFVYYVIKIQQQK